MFCTLSMASKFVINRVIIITIGYSRYFFSKLCDTVETRKELAIGHAPRKCLILSAKSFIIYILIIRKLNKAYNWVYESKTFNFSHCIGFRQSFICKTWTSQPCSNNQKPFPLGHVQYLSIFGDHWFVLGKTYKLLNTGITFMTIDK